MDNKISQSRPPSAAPQAPGAAQANLSAPTGAAAVTAQPANPPGLQEAPRRSKRRLLARQLSDVPAELAAQAEQITTGIRAQREREQEQKRGALPEIPVRQIFQTPPELVDQVVSFLTLEQIMKTGFFGQDEDYISEVVWPRFESLVTETVSQVDSLEKLFDCLNMLNKVRSELKDASNHQLTDRLVTGYLLPLMKRIFTFSLNARERSIASVEALIYVFPFEGRPAEEELLRKIGRGEPLGGGAMRSSQAYQSSFGRWMP
jgi:hypothetical protein